MNTPFVVVNLALNVSGALALYNAVFSIGALWCAAAAAFGGAFSGVCALRQTIVKQLTRSALIYLDYTKRDRTHVAGRIY
jgi:hypothetical protein